MSKRDDRAYFGDRTTMRTMSRAAFAAFAFAGFAGPMSPLAAQQTSVRQEYEDIKNGIGFGPERPPIDYTERAPLVVPPSYNLPPPGGPDPERLGINDPDVAARRRALTDSRRPVPPTDPGAYATGRMQRKYLIDPPSGMRDPAAVAADITHDSDGNKVRAGGAAKHARHRKKAAAQEAAQ
jgi:hypothetical protein